MIRPAKFRTLLCALVLCACRQEEPASEPPLAVIIVDDPAPEPPPVSMRVCGSERPGPRTVPRPADGCSAHGAEGLFDVGACGPEPGYHNGYCDPEMKP